MDNSGRCDRTKYDCDDGTDEYNCGEHLKFPDSTFCHFVETHVLEKVQNDTNIILNFSGIDTVTEFRNS